MPQDRQISSDDWDALTSTPAQSFPTMAESVRYLEVIDDQIWDLKKQQWHDGKGRTIMVDLLPVVSQKFTLPESADFFALTKEHIRSESWDTWTNMLQHLPKCTPKGPWIAGGAVRRMFLEQSPWTADIDYFVSNVQTRQLLESRLEMMDAQKSQETKDQITYLVPQIWNADRELPPLKVQVIKARYRDTLEAHLREFDYTICQTGWDGTRFIVSTRGYKDLTDHRLNLVGPLHTISGSWMRILKYASQGFAPTSETVRTLLLKVGETDLKNIESE